MQAFPEVAWMEAFRERVNADTEMHVIGEWFSTSLSLTFGERRYVLRLERGEAGASPRDRDPAASGDRWGAARRAGAHAAAAVALAGRAVEPPCSGR